jgi:hypothetical protein
MRLIIALIIGLIAGGGFTEAGRADPWKNESGKRMWGDARQYDSYERPHERRRFRHALRIPKGHLPPPGECRRWYPDRPAGHQTPPFRCR